MMTLLDDEQILDAYAEDIKNCPWYECCQLSDSWLQLSGR